MLYDDFINWLFRKKPPCEHEWVKTGFVISFTNRIRDKYECTKCRKKEKRDPRSSRTDIIMW